MNILDKTFNEMNYTFSSNEFSRKAKKYGINQFQINSGLLASYLHQNAKQLHSKRMWVKNNISNFDNKNDSLSIDEAINILKKNGYKVMKPINEWVEI